MALAGSSGSPLLAGASGRLWLTDDGHLRHAYYQPNQVHRHNQHPHGAGESVTRFAQARSFQPGHDKEQAERQETDQQEEVPAEEVSHILNVARALPRQVWSRSKVAEGSRAACGMRSGISNAARTILSTFRVSSAVSALMPMIFAIEAPASSPSRTGRMSLVRLVIRSWMIAAWYYSRVMFE